MLPSVVPLPESSHSSATSFPFQSLPRHHPCAGIASLFWTRRGEHRVPRIRRDLWVVWASALKKTMGKIFKGIIGSYVPNPQWLSLGFRACHLCLWKSLSSLTPPYRQALWITRLQNFEACLNLYSLQSDIFSTMKYIGCGSFRWGLLCSVWTLNISTYACISWV